MSDQDNSQNKDQNLDIEMLAFGQETTDQERSEEEDKNSLDQQAASSDPSLANIHTGDKDLYENSTESRENSGEFDTQPPAENDVLSVAPSDAATSGENLRTFDTAPTDSETVVDTAASVSSDADNRIDGNYDFEALEQNDVSNANQVLSGNGAEDESRSQTELEAQENYVNIEAQDIEMDGGHVDENSALGTSVGIVTAVDPEGGKLTFSLSDDADGRFAIDPDTGEITVAGDIDYETADRHTLVVDVYDGASVTQQTFEVTVGDIDEAAHSVELADNHVDENSALGTVVGTVTAEDPEGGTLSYTLSDDAGGMFTIDANTGEVKVADALDFENTDSYTVTVDVSDGTHITQETLTINVDDVNEAATSVTLDSNAVLEDATIGTSIGTVTAIDPEGDSFTYSLVDDAGGLFSIDPNTGEVSVAGALDHETMASPTIIVAASDGEHITHQTFTIDVGDVNEAAHSIVLDDNNINENSSIGTVVGSVSAQDPEGDTLVYSLADNAGGKFTINSSTGEIKVTGALDHEAADSHTVVVNVSDSEHITQETFTINVTDVNEGAESVALDNNSVDEDATVGTSVGTVTAVDPEGDTLSYSLSDDAGGQFTIDAVTGEITVAGPLDHETAANPSITVDISDGVNVTQQTFTIDVGDINETVHSVVLDDNNIAENSSIGSVVGTVSATDPEEGALTYSLVDDAGGMFTIDAATGEIKVAGALDHETLDNYTVTVDVTDGVFSEQQTFTLNVTDVNEAAHSVGLDANNIDEDAAIGDVIGTVSASDYENDTLTYTLADDAGGQFTIDQNTGELKVASGLDFETDPNPTVIVNVSDGTNVTQQSFTINVGDIDEAVHSVSLDENTIDENSTVGSVVGTVTGVDPESGALNYSLSDDAGGLFTIDAATGEIKVAGALDFEAADSHTVTVDVSDGTHVTQETFTINVSDINEAAHSIEMDNTTVADNVAAGTVVGTVTGVDPEGGTLTYRLTDDSESMFGVDPLTGEIYVVGDLDFQTNPTHSVEVEVSDGVNTTLQTFTIDVTDINEAAHTVELDENIINESAAVGDVIGTVTAIDPENDTLSFSLSDDAGGLFTIDASTGELKVAGSLDYENTDQHTVVVDVFDGVSATQQTFTVDVENYNEAAHSITIDNDTVDENTALGTSVGTISATDPESGVMFYSLADDAGGLFSIDASTGEITVAGDLDHEAAGSHTLIVNVNDGRHNSQQSITINVGDVDEDIHSVELDNNTVSEGASIGTVVGTVDATDPEGATLSYSLSDDAGGMFTIDANTGQVELAGALDHETADSYTVTVDVTDGSQVTQQTLTINVGDENEAAHSLPLAGGTVTENAASGTVVGTVSGVDPEGGALSYRLTDDAGGLFKIDPFTGEITVNGDVDYETAASYNVTVDVSDGPNVTQQTFTINVGDINEAAHSVSLDNNDVDGAALVGDVVGNVSAVDPEGAALTYSLSDDAGGKFTIDANTGEITVAGALEPHLVDDYSITVDVSDGVNVTQKTFMLDMAGQDEAAHSISLSDNSVDENCELGTVVGTVSATDPEGGTLSYSLSDDAGGLFDIDPSTGEITVTGNLDHETHGSCSVTVDVSDGTNITQQTFTIHVGDLNEAPDSIALDNNAVGEEASIGDTVGTVSAVDPEGGTIFYSLSDDAGGLFAIDETTGEVTVAGNLDYEDATSHTITVDVNDGKSVSSQTFTINIGDDDEAVHSVSLSSNDIGEDASIGDSVGTVSAVDPEGEALSYSLFDDAGGLFSIDAVTGEITVAGGLDHDTAASHNLIVDVSDGTNVTQQTFTIDVGGVNEAAHSMTLDDNTVDENTSIGTLVGTVSATDPEGGTLSYRLTDDAGGKFTIDPFTGEIKVAGSLNHEKVDSYDLTVEVSDGTHTTQETYTIDIGDVDEKVKRVKLDNNAVDENSTAGTVVGTVSGTDPEGGTLSYSLSDDAAGLFSIDAATGEIKVAGNLDHEAAGSHSVTVDVSDGTNVTQKTFSIDVGDVNESIQSLTLPDNTVDENSSIGSVVGTVVADDPEGGSLFYSLSDDAGGMFTIDAATGDIKVAGALDHETTDTYSVTVDVSDGTHITQQTFTINVADVDEAAHSVAMDANSVDEDATVGTLIGTVSAQDYEGDTLTYALSDDAGGLFSIDVNTGEVHVAGGLDHETAATHSITVDVSDGTNVTQQVLTINVGDVNEAVHSVTLDDNGVDENSTIGTVVGNVSATDPEDGSLTYTLLDDAGGMFTVDSATGEIKVAGALDHEGTDSYSVTAEVSDGVHTAQETFTLNVDDINEGPTAVNVDLGSVDEDNSILFTSADLLSSSSDVDGDAISITDVSVDANYGTITEVSPGNYRFDPKADYSSNDVPIVFTVSDGTLTNTATASLDVMGVADGATLSVALGDIGTDTVGGETVHQYGLDITVGEVDTDGSEVLSDIIISNIPMDGTLSVGTDLGGGSWSVSEADLDGLTLNVPSDTDADFDITVSVQSVDGASISTASSENLTIPHYSDEMVIGTSGDDTLSAGIGDDTMQGGEGADVFHGGAGDDYAVGGAGDDMFHFASTDGNDTFIGGDGGGWADTIVLSEGAPAGDIGDWLELTSGSVQSTAEGEIFLSEDAAGTITLDGDATLTFEGVEKIEI